MDRFLQINYRVEDLDGNFLGKSAELIVLDDEAYNPPKNKIFGSDLRHVHNKDGEEEIVMYKIVSVLIKEF